MAVKKSKSKSKSKKKQLRRQLKLKGINPAVRPTEQEIRIAENYVAKGMKKGEALVAAGVSPANARSNSAEIFARPGVRAAVALALDEAGVGIRRVAQVLNEGLAATKVISANLLMVDDGKETPEIIDATEESESLQKAFIRVEDYAVRHKYLETSIDLLELRPKDGPGGADLDPDEEMEMIKRAEASVSQRDFARYTVIRERSQV